MLPQTPGFYHVHERIYCHMIPVNGRVYMLAEEHKLYCHLYAFNKTYDFHAIIIHFTCGFTENIIMSAN